MESLEEGNYNRKGKYNLVDKITVNNTQITNRQEISDEMNEYFA